jgi:hypothetical protein
VSEWSAAAAEMDVLVDSTLADPVLYSIGGAPFRAIDAFIKFEETATGFGEIDELMDRVRLKVARNIIERPRMGDRVRCHERLGSGTWRPVNENHSEQGRYWLVDLQRADT